MRTETLHRLIDRAREDAGFFHALVFDPDRVLAQDLGLSEHELAALYGNTPDLVIGHLVGETESCGGGETCSCTSGTCPDTCGGSTCNVTCSGDSCGRTCDNSCGYTTNFTYPYESDYQFVEGAVLRWR